MRLTWRDAWATMFVGVAGAVYAGWATGAAFADLSVTQVGAIVFGLGFVGCVVDAPAMADVYGTDRERRPPMTFVVLTSVLGFAALVTGIVTLVTAAEGALALLVAAMLALWVMATVRHALVHERPVMRPAHA